jgi:hypothetical protein
MLRARFLWYLLTCINIICKCQSATFYLKGYVYDVDSNKPLPYATIRISRSNTGTISSGDGHFSLETSQEITNDTLSIQYIGYSSGYYIIEPNHNNEIRIALQKKSENLTPVIINGNTPITMLKKAIDNIQKNYSNQTYWMQAYYTSWEKEDTVLCCKVSLDLNIRKSSYDLIGCDDSVEINQGKINCIQKNYFGYGNPIHYFLRSENIKWRSNFLDELNFASTSVASLKYDFQLNTILFFDFL